MLHSTWLAMHMIDEFLTQKIDRKIRHEHTKKIDRKMDTNGGNIFLHLDKLVQKALTFAVAVGPGA